MDNIKIISQVVLNEDTGELETQDLKVLEIKKPKAKGGFRMTYCKYDEVQIKVVTSSTDMKIFHEIKNCFTYSQIEVCFNLDRKKQIAKYCECSVKSVERMIKKMTEEKLLGKISRGVYRLNPFMFIPFGCKARKLQDYWRETFDETLEEVIEDIKEKQS